MNAQFGKPLKSVALLANDRKVRSKAVTSEKGLEGDRIYEITRDLRQNHDLKIDLLPDYSFEKLHVPPANQKSKQAEVISGEKRSNLDLKNKRF